jgi:hypothetical protein
MFETELYCTSTLLTAKSSTPKKAKTSAKISDALLPLNALKYRLIHTELVTLLLENFH